MDSFFLILILITIAIVLMIIIAILIVLVRDNKKLKKDCLNLNKTIEQNSKDIAGLCSAAVFVDNKLSGSDEQLKQLIDRLIEVEQNYERQLDQSYHTAIQHIHQGASVNELMDACGLSREEAVLLIRLHGSQIDSGYP